MTTPIMKTAVLQFLPNWETIQRGQVQRGGKLVIDYDAERLSEARTQFRGSLLGELEAYVKFHPRGQMYSGSAVEKVLSEGTGGHVVVVELSEEIYEVMDPTNALQVEMWFRGFYQISRHCGTADTSRNTGSCSG